MHMDRRQFVKNLGLGTASLSMGSLVTASSCAPVRGIPPLNEKRQGRRGWTVFIYR